MRKCHRKARIRFQIQTWLSDSFPLIYQRQKSSIKSEVQSYTHEQTQRTYTRLSWRVHFHLKWWRKWSHISNLSHIFILFNGLSVTLFFVSQFFVILLVLTILLDKYLVKERWTIQRNVVKGSACLASTHWLKYWIQFFYFAERNLTGIEQKCANNYDVKSRE